MNVKDLVRQNAIQLVALALEAKDRERVEGFVKRWQQGEHWSPIRAHETGYVVDGQHRLLAAVMMNHQTIDVELI